MKRSSVLLAAGMLAIGLLAVVVAAAQPSPALAQSGEGASPQSPPAARVRRGLQVLYDFSASTGSLVTDRSGVGEPLNLRILDPSQVTRTAGAVEFRGSTRAETPGPATKLVRAVRQTNELTVELWVQPARGNQAGPARILTLSENASQRNFTLGQDGDRVDVRLRSTSTSTNGIPSLASGQRSLPVKLVHLAYTRTRDGKARLFVNGGLAGERRVAGSLSNWNPNYRLALGNELSGDRPWLGTIRLVAISNQALSEREIAQNFRAGPAAAEPVDPQVLTQRRQEEYFETRVAALLAEHCLECHDASSRQGGLDLSRKQAALAGGDSGKVLVAGKPAESLLWNAVVDDQMPAKRPPLSAQQKELLKQWIAEGAVWSLDWIDPAVYAHGETPGNRFVRRLTLPEYVATVQAAVGVDIAPDAEELLPPDLRADGFRNTAYNLTVDLKRVDAYAKLAERIVRRMDVEKFAARFTKSKKLTDDNMRPLVAQMGKWLLRGPLAEHEVVTYRGISTSVASAGGDFREAVSYILEAMLQSPRFIYRIENQRGDGTAWPVDQYELASRVSYLVWGACPDAELLAAADAGKLDRDEVRRQVQRMLQDPRAIARSKQFLSEWLNLPRLANLNPDKRHFPKWDPRLAEDMRRETLAFFEEVIWKQRRPLSHLLNAQVTFATPRLAAHYGLAPAAADGEERPGQRTEGDVPQLQRYDLSEDRWRGGLLTQGAVLTIGGDEASMVTRGLFVMHQLLRGTVKDPPPCVDTTPVPTKAGLSRRGIAEARLANQACGGCHRKFEPLAFGLEMFDGLGTFHQRDGHGNQLREDGGILIPGGERPVEYRRVGELMDLLANSERVQETLTWKVVQFALGRSLGVADWREVQRIHRAAQQAGGSFPELVAAIANSDLILTTHTESER